MPLILNFKWSSSKWEKKPEEPTKPTEPNPETPGTPTEPTPETPGIPETPPEVPGTPTQIIDSTPGGNVTPDTGAPGFDANNVAPHTQSTTNTAIEPGQYVPWIDGVAPTPDSGIPINTNPNW
jgi:outer membrane biosynthesis protein TonB